MITFWLVSLSEAWKCDRCLVNRSFGTMNVVDNVFFLYSGEMEFWMEEGNVMNGAFNREKTNVGCQ